MGTRHVKERIGFLSRGPHADEVSGPPATTAANSAASPIAVTQEAEIDVRVSAAVLAPVPQETAEQLTRRADETLMHENALAQAV